MYSLPNRGLRRLEPPISDSGIARHQSFALPVEIKTLPWGVCFVASLLLHNDPSDGHDQTEAKRAYNQQNPRDGSQTAGFSERTGWILSAVRFKQAWWNRQRKNCADAQLVTRQEHTIQYPLTIQGHVFRCASISWIHVGESVSDSCFWDFVK